MPTCKSSEPAEAAIGTSPIAPLEGRIEFTDLDYLEFLTRGLDGLDMVILANLER